MVASSSSSLSDYGDGTVEPQEEPHTSLGPPPIPGFNPVDGGDSALFSSVKQAGGEAAVGNGTVEPALSPLLP